MKRFSFVAAATATRNRDSAIPLLLLVGSTAVSIGLSISLVGALMPEVSREFGLSDTEAGFAQSIFFLGHVVGILFLGKTLGRWSASRLWLLASSATAAGICVCAGGSFWLLLLGRTLAGFGLSLSVILVSSLLVSQAPKRAGRLLSGFHGTVAASASLALSLAPWLAARLGTWQTAMAATGVVCMIPILVACCVSVPKLGAKSSGEAARDGSSLAAFIALIFIVGAYVSTEQIVTAFLPLVLSSYASPEIAGQIAALFWAGVIVGRMVAAFGGEAKLSDRTMLLLGGLTMTTSLILLAVSSSTVLVAGFAFLAGLGGGPLLPIGFAMAAQWARRPSEGVLACQAACFVGGFFGPTLAGVSANSIGLSSELIAWFGLAPAFGCLLLLLSLIKLNHPLRLLYFTRTQGAP